MEKSMQKIKNVNIITWVYICIILMFLLRVFDYPNMSQGIFEGYVMMILAMIYDNQTKKLKPGKDE